MIKAGTMELELWSIQTAVFFKVFSNMECHKKDFSNIQMVTSTKANLKIINRTVKVSGNSKKVFLKEYFKTVTSKMDKSNIQMVVITKVKCKTWKNQARTVFIALQMETFLWDRLEMISFAKASILQKIKTWFMKDSLMTDRKNTEKDHWF